MAMKPEAQVRCAAYILLIKEGLLNYEIQRSGNQTD